MTIQFFFFAVESSLLFFFRSRIFTYFVTAKFRMHSTCYSFFYFVSWGLAIHAYYLTLKSSGVIYLPTVIGLHSVELFETQTRMFWELLQYFEGYCIIFITRAAAGRCRIPGVIDWPQVVVVVVMFVVVVVIVYYSSLHLLLRIISDYKFSLTICFSLFRRPV